MKTPDIDMQVNFLFPISHIGLCLSRDPCFMFKDINGSLFYGIMSVLTTWDRIFNFVLPISYEHGDIWPSGQNVM